MYKIGIVGLGFLGGSLAKSLRATDIVGDIIAFDKNLESLKLAKSENVINDYSEKIDEKFYNCDIVFICTPVKLISEIAKELDKVVNKHCIITDTGSTKRKIISTSKYLEREFIGGHPMVGSERSGYQTSKEFLFENSYYIITKSEKTTQRAINILKEIIIAIGAIPIIIDEDKHDYITATISHVPHVIAYSLVSLVKQLDDENETMKNLAAGGFKDITRIASSDPVMWENICSENKEEILKILSVFKDIINKFEQGISDSETIYNFFAESKKYRDSFINKRINGNSLPELNINIKDENGAIATIATILSAKNISIKNLEILNNRENNYGALKIIFNTYEQMEEAHRLLKQFGYEVKENM